MGARPPSTAGGRVLGSTQPRPPARFSSLRSQEIVNHKQEPWGNTLLAQRYPISGNSYFWRTAYIPFHRIRRQGVPADVSRRLSLLRLIQPLQVCFAEVVLHDRFRLESLRSHDCRADLTESHPMAPSRPMKGEPRGNALRPLLGPDDEGAAE